MTSRLLKKKTNVSNRSFIILIELLFSDSCGGFTVSWFCFLIDLLSNGILSRKNEKKKHRIVNRNLCKIQRCIIFCQMLKRGVRLRRETKSNSTAQVKSTLFSNLPVRMPSVCLKQSLNVKCV